MGVTGTWPELPKRALNNYLHSQRIKAVYIELTAADRGPYDGTRHESQKVSASSC